MIKFKVIIKVFLALVVAFVCFTLWYNYTYDMEVISGYEVNTPVKSKSILIASQGSEYKNEIVQRLVNHYKEKDVYLKIIDVTELEKTSMFQFDALVLLHTWEIGHPPVEVSKFLNQNKEFHKKMVIVTTSGDGMSNKSELIMLMKLGILFKNKDF